jgi:acetyltransferase-like isoleucine patch superfamily enzyme
MKGITIGKHCHIGMGVIMAGNIEIGDRTVIGEYTYLGTMPAGHLKIGEDCHINSMSSIGASKSVIIDDHCIFAPFIQITDASHGIDNKIELIKHAPISAESVCIGKNVWLGSGVVVLMGVTIGEGSVIGAKALVNKSIPEYSIAVGIPAQVIRKRD